MAGRKTVSGLFTGQGIEIREAHYPDRAPIDAYGNGGFRFAGMSHIGSLLCLPSGIHDWHVSKPSQLTVSAFSQIIEEAENIEILLIGTGLDIVPISQKLRKQLRNASIQADAMTSGAAVRTYNVLLAEDRAVAAAFLAV